MSDGQKPKGKKKSLGVPLAVARQQLIDDANTQAIALAFGISVEKYADTVLSYAQNPDKEPELFVLDEDEMEGDRAGLPTSEDMLNWLNQVERGEIELGGVSVDVDVMDKSGASNKNKQFSNLSLPRHAPKSGAPMGQVMVDGDDPVGSVLKDQLLKQRTQVKIGGQKPVRKKQKP